MEEYLKLLSLATIMPMTPKSVQKKLLFEFLQNLKITLTKEELEKTEHMYKDSVECVSIRHIQFWMNDYLNWDYETMIERMEQLQKTLQAMQNEH